MTTTKNNEHKKLNFSSERAQSQVCLNSAEHEKNQGRKVLNVPNLRFPEFQGEWEKHELGDICETITDFVAAGSFASLRENVKYYQEDNFAQLVRTVDLKKDFTNNDFVYVDEFAYDFLWRVQLKEPNIVLPNIGANIGEKYYVSTKDLPKEKNVLGPNAILLRSKCNDTHFVYFRLSTSSYDNEMKKLVGASGQPKFNKTDLKKVRLFMPSLKEQKKISYFLGLLEERIATQNKIIEDLKKLKCAIIEKLYYKIQGKEYLYRQLFDVVNERNKQMEYYNILSASQEKGMVNRDDLNLDIQFERSNINTYKIVREGDYVIHLRSFQGGFAFSDKLGVCSPAYTILRPNSLLEYGYMSFYFTSQRFIKSLIIVTYGIRDGRSINVEEWLNMKIVVPSKEYQLHTLNVLKSIDNKIVNEEMYATCLSNQKQYLLHNMFI